MAVIKKDKNFARQLYQKGKSTKEISVECDVNIRTAQRWIKLFEKENVVVTNLADPEAEVTEPVSALEKIAVAQSSQSVAVNIPQRLAVRLLNLTESAISGVEECLKNPYSSDASKLKAAQLVGKWVGLEEHEYYAIPSIIRVIAHKLDVTPSFEINQPSQMNFSFNLEPKPVEKQEVNLSEILKKIS
ncbi:MAG: helix-turn-helix domain-containing protein [Cyanobacteria bacterium J06633_8]